MPYILQLQRDRLDNGGKALSAGELNYQISKLLNDYLATGGLSYKVVNEVIGALECAKAELYRRIAGPYEDKKLGENGEVFTFQGTQA